jgi:pimeloyl-ACP methyl ester carboxylesterase
VQFRPSLNEGIWLLAPAAHPWPSSFTHWTDAPPADDAARFYRVWAVPAAQRGNVLSSVLVTTLSTNEIGLVFALGDIPVVPHYGVRLYRVVYETTSPLGARTQASAALVLPLNVGEPLPLVTYQHGTLTQTNAAPSSMNLQGEITVGVAFATTGYAAALPDYLGLGDSPGLHPYQQARSEATVGVDLLRAVRTLCATNGFPLTNQLFICGYSQGGHAAMALCRELETFHTNEFTVTACAPMAGAYDLSGVTTDDFLSDRPKPNPYYYAYLLAAYQDVYRLAPTFADLLAPPYDMTLPPLFQGNSDGDEINNAMPADPRQILKPEYLAAFQNDPNHPFRIALRDNDLHLWTPRSPMRLYHCAGDTDVILANSQVTWASFQSRGATQVQLIDPEPGASHGDCVLPSLQQVKAWFDSLR